MLFKLYSAIHKAAGQPAAVMGSGGRSVRRFPIDIFPFCRERPVTKEPAAL